MLKKTALAVLALSALVATAGCAPQPGGAPSSTSSTSHPSQPSASEPPATGTDETGPRKPSEVTVQMQIEGGDAYTLSLYDNPTAKSLIDQLPLTVTSDDYPGYDEKVLRLDEGLSMNGAPDGDDPLWPEVGWYEPGGWIAIYYGHIGYFAGKVPLGTIDATNEQLAAIPVGATITFTLN
jgi:hypothetical protein